MLNKQHLCLGCKLVCVARGEGIWGCGERGWKCVHVCVCVFAGPAVDVIARLKMIVRFLCQQQVSPVWSWLPSQACCLLLLGRGFATRRVHCLSPISVYYPLDFSCPKQNFCTDSKYDWLMHGKNYTVRYERVIGKGNLDKQGLSSEWMVTFSLVRWWMVACCICQYPNWSVVCCWHRVLLCTSLIHSSFQQAALRVLTFCALGCGNYVLRVVSRYLSCTWTGCSVLDWHNTGGGSHFIRTALGQICKCAILRIWCDEKYHVSTCLCEIALQYSGLRLIKFSHIAPGDCNACTYLRPQ